MTHETDEALVDAARSGRHEALDALASRYFGMVYAIGLARLGNREEAEDLAQEVFLRVFLVLDQLEQRALFSHWLARITRNLAIDWQRRGERASRLLPMIPMDELSHKVPDEGTRDARDGAASGEQSAALREVLARLSPKARELVLLHYMEGLSQRDIAQRMGINQSTVTRHISRSLASMRTLMECSLHGMARGLASRPEARAKTLAIAATVAALPAATRSSIAAMAAQGIHSAARTSSTKASGGAITALTSALSLLKTGGTVVGIGKIAAGAGIVVALGAGGFHFLGSTKSTVVKPAGAEKKVGTYDSRSVAIAWVRSNPFNKWMGALQDEHSKAKAAGDQNRVKELEAEGQRRQATLNRQGFSTAPVDEILVHIEDQIPEIQKKAGVDLLISKWDKKKLTGYTPEECVDVTMALVDAFQPTPTQRTSAIEIQKKSPIPLQTATNLKN
ncbi:MAG: RNA polymerase sigma factor [Candidatus Sumerlaeaceae bacterium]|nr:RNA polymerase sigma factor [Candidatus Sumerlaeaceae bacterium]